MSGPNEQAEGGRPADLAAIAGSAGLVHRHPHTNGESGQDHGKDADARVAFDVENGAAGGSGGSGDAKDADAGGDAAAPAIVDRVSYADIAKQFSLLGWTAFGGPAAHIGIMQRVRGLAAAARARTASAARPTALAAAAPGAGAPCTSTSAAGITAAPPRTRAGQPHQRPAAAARPSKPAPH